MIGLGVDFDDPNFELVCRYMVMCNFVGQGNDRFNTLDRM